MRPRTSDSVLGHTTQVADELVVGAFSRVAWNDSISCELSSHAPSAGAARGENVSCHESRHWWRVDGRHDSFDDTELLPDQGTPTVGRFNQDLAAELRVRLSSQIDVGQMLSAVDWQSGLSNAALEMQATKTTQTSGRTHPENPSGVMSQVICGLHALVSQQVLRGLGLDASALAKAESFAEQEKALEKESASELVAAVSANPLGVELGDGPRVSNESFNSLDTCEVLPHPNYLHQSERVTSGSFVFGMLGVVADTVGQHRDAWSHGDGVSEGLTTNQLASFSKELVRGDLLDATRLFAIPKTRVPTTHHSAGNCPILKAQEPSGASDLGSGQSRERSALICHRLEEGRRGRTLDSSERVKSSVGGTAVVRDHDFWHEHWAGHSSRESVRWLVGNLLLMDSESSRNNATNVIPAVSELLAIGFPCGAIESQEICGAWSVRIPVEQPVDIHRVVLQLHSKDSHRGGSWIITALSEPDLLGSAFGHSHAASAEVRTPRAWVRVSEFRLVVGSRSIDTAIKVGNNIAFASTHGTAPRLRMIFENEVHDVFASTAIKPTSSDWGRQCRNLLSVQHPIVGASFALSSTSVELGTVSECSRWDAAASEADVVRCSMFVKVMSQVDLPCMAESTSGMVHQVLADELIHRIQAGPVFLNGVENFYPMSPGNHVSVGSRQGFGRASELPVATLDERFLRSWSFSKWFTRRPDQTVIGRDEAVGRMKSIHVGITDTGVSEASTGQLICGIEVMSNQKSQDRLYRPTMVMRQAESTVAMQAASSFSFRHRAHSARLTEQVSNSFLQHESAFVNHDFVSCDQLVEIDANVSICDLVQASETNVCDALAEYPDRTDSSEQCTFQSIVMCAGFTHACTLMHVPQYLNRAAWCRKVTPRLLAAVSKMNVAEQFFPPLVSFELPRLVLPVMSAEKTSAVHCAAIMIGDVPALPVSFWAGQDFHLERRENRSGDQRTLRQSCEGSSSMIHSAVECPTSTLIRRLRVAGQLRNLTDPLKNYLRANRSLSEVLCDPKEHGTAAAAGSTRFLMMTEKRSLRYLRQHCGVQLVSQLVVKPVPLGFMTPVDADLGESVSESRLTDQKTHEDMMRRSGNTEVSVGASLDRGAVRHSGEVLNPEACCSVPLHLLEKPTASGAHDNARNSRVNGIVWIPESRNRFVEVETLRLSFEAVGNAVAGKKVEFSSAPVLLQVDAHSSPKTFTRPREADEAVARKLESSFVIYPSEIQTSLNLTVGCRNHRCTTSVLDRAA